MPERKFPAPATFRSLGKDAAAPNRCVRDYTLTLRANGIFVERIVLLGREQSEWMGAWRFDAVNNKLVLTTTLSNLAEVFRLSDPRSFERLDSGAKALSSGCVVRLTRSATVVEFSGEMKPVTLSSDLWTLERLGDTDVAAVEGARVPTLTFDGTARRFTGSIGCNRLSGAYTANGAELTFSAVAMTHKTCPRPDDDLEARFLLSLKRTTAFHICCSTLELRDARGALARFRTTR